MCAVLSLGVFAGSASAKAKPGLTAAQKKQLKTAVSNSASALAQLKTINTSLKTTNANAATLSSTVTSLQALATTLSASATSSLMALQTAVTQVGTGLTTLAGNVANPTTGLPGLNLARPQIGVVLTNAAHGQFTGTHVATGVYVLTFAEDVSSRVLEATPFPGEADVTIGAADCAATGVTCPGADVSADDVLVTTYAGNTATDEDFQLAAISG
jgi:hypothetical protein